MIRTFNHYCICSFLVLNLALSRALEMDYNKFSIAFDNNNLSNNSWMKDLLIGCKSISIIDTAFTGESNDQRSTLLLEFFEDIKANVLVFTETIRNQTQIFQGKRFQVNQFIILFKTLDDFRQSLLKQKNYVFLDSPASIFVIFILETSSELGNCSNKEDSMMKEVTGDLFLQLWKSLRILKVLMVLSNICGSQKLLLFDPILHDAENKPALGVRVIHRSDASNHHKLTVNHWYSKFNGYPLDVKLFTRTPTCVRNLPDAIMSTYLSKDIDNNGGAGGIDGFLLGNLAKYLNFTLKISESSDGIEYGGKSDDGNFTGTIGDVISRRTDISFNGRFLKDYGSPDILFTTPVFNDQLCVLVPKSATIPTWMNIFQGFSVTVWEITLTTVFICGLVWWLLKKMTFMINKSQRKSNFCWNCMDGFLLIASQPITLPKIHSERIFIAACLIFNIILTGTFQGYLYTAFSTTNYYAEINTLAALDESGLPIATSSNLDDIFGTDGSPVMMHLKNKIKRLSTAAIDRAAKYRDVCAVERKTDAGLLIQIKYVGRNRVPLLHIVEQCPRNYYLAYVVHKNYPFLPHINKFLSRVWEGGFNKFWYDMTIYSIIQNQIAKSIHFEDGLKKLSLVDVQTAFFALVSGLVMSSVAFLCEHFWKILKRRKTPLNITTGDNVIF